MQQIRFRSKDNLQAIADNPAKKKTMLMEWLDYNEQYIDGRNLTYLNFPLEYTWNKTDKHWQRRRRQNKPMVGRLTYIHPTVGDMFYQRILLCHQKGCRYFREIRTVNGIVFPINRAACEALGLIGSDEEWIPRVEENETEMKGGTLFEIEAILNSNSRTLKDFGLPMPPRKLLHILENRVIMEERNYDCDLLLKEKDVLLRKLNKDQKLILDEVLKAVNNNQQTLIFVYGHDGTGKTFLWKSIACVLRSKERVVLVVAS
ncbi:DNA helicase [Tanacetum coccineum]